MILLIAMDTYYNFRFFSMRDEEGKNRVCGRQLVCMFMLHFLANILIWLNTESVTMLAFYGAQVVFFLLYIYLTRLFYRNSSRLLVNNMCTLLATGFIILTRLNPDRAMRQFVIVAALHVLVLVLSKDLGSALIFFVAYMTMLFVATSSYLWFGAGIAGGSLAAVAAYYLFPHVRRRVEAWADPWSDIANKGYQVAQALFAIGTGGWFGMGLYRGMPEKIPVVDKDFVFAAISEEMGALYALCVLFLCLGCYMQFMLIAFGLGSVYITQVFLTIGGVTKFIPSTGVTLPLVSYGGSSIVSTFIIFQVIQGLYVLKRGEEEEEENSSEEE